MQIHRRIPRNLARHGAGLLSLAVYAATLSAQTAPSADSAALGQILERLDRLEKQNRELIDEVQALRGELAQSRGPAEAKQAEDVNEKLEVQERRMEEQAQTKVESSQHFPLRITGMALFNSYFNSRQTGSLEAPPIAPLSGGAFSGGATLRQTILGIEYRGPEILGGGKISGILNMDFMGGSGEPYDSLFRIRTAALRIDWKTTSVMFGQDKPLISPREPNSLAQVGISPLAGAGNLWLWQPQMRVEQRINLDPSTTLRAQVGIFQTREDYGYVPPVYTASIQEQRPALQGRFSLSHNLDDDRRIEIGSGFHASDSHVAGWTVPSRVFALDWFANPWRRLEFSGSLFRGQNLTNIGGVGEGFTFVNDYTVIPVHAEGGWTQLSFIATPRLTFNVFGGLQNNRGSDIYYGLARNAGFAANFMYRLAPNVILSFESGQVRTEYLDVGKRLNNHNDLGVAYLF